MEQILVHACCGVCFSYPLLFLRDLGLEPVVFYFNSNIAPQEEFERRYSELERYCKANSVHLIKSPYNHGEFLDEVKGLENELERGERCKKCFYYRLKHSIEFALKLNITKVTTTLTISPHKISQDIFAAAKKVINDIDAKDKLNMEFLKFDFKKKDGFKKTSKIAYDFGMYRQNYCGCEFSKNKTGAK